MADYLTCLDFYGLPGSGKSVVSHRICEYLRSRGYKVTEASYLLDNRKGRWGRIIAKTWRSFCLMLSHYQVFRKVCSKVSECGYRGRELFIQRVNLLYKFHYLLSGKRGVLVFDEGIIQSCISLSVPGKRKANELFAFFRKLFPEIKYVAVKIDSGIDRTLENLSARPSSDSRVEKLSNQADRREFLERIQDQVSGFDDLCSAVLTIEEASGEHSDDILRTFEVKYLNN